MGRKISQFPAASTINDADVLAGVQGTSNKKFSFGLIKSWLQNLFIPASAKGAADGVASLDNTGKVPGTQLDLSGKQDKITAAGILKGDGQGGVTAAVAGTDYQAPLTAGTDYATPAQLADKANQSQLAYVETGTTASRAYAVGEYFCWNGLLYRVKTAISQGATFTVNTNCEQVTDGGLNKIRSTDIPDEINSRFGYLRCVSKVNNTNSGVTLTFDLNGNGVGIMFVQAAGTEGAIYGLTVLDSVTATRLVGSYSPTMNGANPRSFSINVGPWANVTIICTRSGWAA